VVEADWGGQVQFPGLTDTVEKVVFHRWSKFL
jgi:hypothetical protein